LIGRNAFKNYVEETRAAFPDWHNQIDEMLTVGDRVVTRLTGSGTHRGHSPVSSRPAPGSNT